MMMKKWLALALSVLLLFSLTACGGEVVPDETAPEPEDENYVAAMAKLEEGKWQEAYDLFKVSTDPKAADMLEKFVFVPTKVTRKNSNGADMVTTYTYDAQGYLLSDKDVGDLNWNETADRETTYTYDEGHRLLVHHYRYDGDFSYDEIYTYDEKGNELSYTYQFGESDYKQSGHTCTYDEAGNLLTKVYWDKLDEYYNYTEAYTYDDQGRKLTYTTTNYSGKQEVYNYTYAEDGSFHYTHALADRTINTYFDKDGNILKSESVDNETGEVLYLAEYRYDAQGNEIYRYDNSYDSETVITKTYNEQGQLLQSQTTEDGEIFSMATYTYNEAGDVLTYEHFSGTSSWGHTTNVYDEQGRLVKRQRQGVWGWEQSTLTYDEAGNCIQVVTSGSSESGTHDYTYDQWGNVATYVYYGEDVEGEKAGNVAVEWTVHYYPEGIPEKVEDVVDNVAYWIEW